MQVIRIQDTAALKKAAQEALNLFFAENNEQAVLFLASGGSALEILDDFDIARLGSNFTIGVLDERYSQDAEINNFAQIAKTEFYKNVAEKNATFIDTRPGANESLFELALRFEESLNAWRKNNPKGIIVITQGIGEDGHTAGILPYPENSELFTTLFDKPESWTAGYDATLEKNAYPLRVTVTLPFLREMVDQSIVYVSGEKKRKSLERVIDTEGMLWETPARIIRGMKSAIIFTDITIS